MLLIEQPVCVCVCERERVDVSVCMCVYVCARVRLVVIASHLSYAESYIRWLRLVNSLRLQISFAEYRLFYRDLLQKRPIILRSLLSVATPYTCKCMHAQVHVRVCVRVRGLHLQVISDHIQRECV